MSYNLNNLIKIHEYIYFQMVYPDTLQSRTVNCDKVL